MKIGIHYGNVFVGIIGVNKPQLTLLGETINFANKLMIINEYDQI